MTEEELKQEAENNKPPYAFCALNTNCELWKDGYEKGAEPREKRIAELEKQLDIVRNERNLFQERCEDILENYYCDHPCKCAELEKENAELKKQKEMLEKGYVWHDYDAGEDCYEDTHEGKWVKRDEVYQLTKAKDHIKKLLDCLKQDTNDPQTNYYVCQYMDKAEQFLKDSEVEK